MNFYYPGAYIFTKLYERVNKIYNNKNRIQDICLYIIRKDSFCILEFSKELNISYTTSYRIIKNLEKNNIIIGSNRTRYRIFKLNEKELLQWQN